MERKAKFRHYIEAVLIYALPWSLRPLPFAWRVKIGGAILGFAIRAIPVLRRRIMDNLDLIYPEKSGPSKRALLRKIARHIGRGFIEIYDAEDYYKLLSDVKIRPDALEEVAAAQKSGRPVIIVSGHFGQWEAIRVMLLRAGLVSAAIYKTSSNPIFEKRFAKMMSIGGAGLFHVGLSGMRPMLKHLRSGGIVSVLLDQRVNDGELVDFMGQPALSSTAMINLALKTGALVVPTYGRILEGGQTEVIVEPAMPHGDPIAMLQALNDSLAAQVQARPEQWYWLHKRWARPDLQ